MDTLQLINLLKTAADNVEGLNGLMACPESEARLWGIATLPRLWLDSQKMGLVNGPNYKKYSLTITLLASQKAINGLAEAENLASQFLVEIGKTDALILHNVQKSILKSGFSDGKLQAIILDLELYASL